MHQESLKKPPLSSKKDEANKENDEYLILQNIASDDLMFNANLNSTISNSKSCML